MSFKTLRCTTSSLARSRLKRLGTLSLKTRMHTTRATLTLWQMARRYTRTKDSLSILTVNLGQTSLEVARRLLPEKFAQHLDNREHTQVSPLVKSLARSKSHIACVLEASNVDIEEAAYLVRHGWYMQSNKGS